jgi:hypothetical protein
VAGIQPLADTQSYMRNLHLIFDGRDFGTKRLYHYTDSNGFLGIIKNSQLWATDFKDLIDPLEHKHGHNIVKQVVEELIAETSNETLNQLYLLRFNPEIIAESFGRGFYLVSFTENKDSIKHWLDYGKRGNGFAVEFEPSDQFRGIPTEILSTIPHKLIKVVYDEVHQKQIAREILIEMTNYPDLLFELSFLIEYMCIKFKDPKFSDENEWRIVYSPIIQVGYLGEDVDFRDTDNGIIAFHKFSLQRITGAAVGFNRPESELRNIFELLLRHCQDIPEVYKSEVQI